MARSVEIRRFAVIRRKLLTWYDRHRRDLPWRRTRDPYAVWLSEIMLQQTQVATVIPYYRRFLTRFPTVEWLAAAPLDEVLKLWAGLGYYARAGNLHRAAREVVTKWRGRFPSTTGELRTLPGIGAYTAGAIASIAFGRRAALVDGNAARVLTRLFDLKTDVAVGAGRARLWRIAEQLLPQKHCGDFNQALMELGATVCLPGGSARCEVCPLAQICAARRAGTVHDRPVSKKRTAVRQETHIVAAIEHDGQYLVRRRPAGGLWGGLWELPTALLNGSSSVRSVRQLARRLVGQNCRVGREPFCDFTKRLTHREIRFIGHVCRLPGRGLNKATGSATDDLPKGPYRWENLRRLARHGISRAMRQVIFSLAGAAAS